MSEEESRLNRIRAAARHAQEEKAHAAHEAHEADKSSGEAAARLDFPRIVRAIDNYQNKKTVLGSRTLGRMATSGGDGQYTWVMPNDFKSAAAGLPYGGRVIYGSHGFLDAYKDTLRKMLNTMPDGKVGDLFKVRLSGHGSDAHIVVSWVGKSSGH